MVCCPVCAQPLTRLERRWCCPAGHSFDIARQGYVNLLPANHRHSRNPGDSRLAVQARRSFLDSGAYAPLARRLSELTAAELSQSAPPAPPVILDAGCGEGYYLGAVGHACPGAQRIGVDISRDAVRYAAARDRDALWLCASAANLPLAAACCQVLLCVFAYAFPAEFARVLRPGGLWIEVTAGAEHLAALRSVIYPTLHRREKTLPEYEGFVLEAQQTLSFPFELTQPEQIQWLLAMTPHYWRIDKAGAARAAALTRLADQAQMEIRCYRRRTQGDGL